MNKQSISPFDTRYGSSRIRDLWTEENKRSMWRSFWVALAEGMQLFGRPEFSTPPDVLKKLRGFVHNLDLGTSAYNERLVKHDLVAELNTLSDQVGEEAARFLHLGATSSDVEDNVDVLRLRWSCEYVMEELHGVMYSLEQLAENSERTPAYTHWQFAGVTSWKRRFGLYLQDLKEAERSLMAAMSGLHFKGLGGATGTGESYRYYLADPGAFEQFQEYVLTVLAVNQVKIDVWAVTGQTYPRLADLKVFNALAEIAAVLHRMGLDFRVLQALGRVEEPFSAEQVGSSALPFKRNPINSEKVCSLARFVVSQQRLMWDVVANSSLERTLDDSAARRIALPQTLLAVEEMLTTMTRVLQGLVLGIWKPTPDELFKANAEKYVAWACSRGFTRSRAYALVRECWSLKLDLKPDELAARLTPPGVAVAETYNVLYGALV